MGVTCILSSANPAQVRLLTANPRLVEPFLDAGETKYSPTWMQRLLGRAVPAEVLAVDDSMRTDLDKAWHGIHFLLTGKAEEAPLPAGMLFSGGRALAGSSHLLDPSQVADCHRYLSALPDEQIARAYDPDRMDELDIYPNIWRRDGNEALDYLLANLQTLRAVLRDCVDEGHGLVITIE
jgi:uncharacterized protein DUF1877